MLNGLAHETAPSPDFMKNHKRKRIKNNQSQKRDERPLQLLIQLTADKNFETSCGCGCAAPPTCPPPPVCSPAPPVCPPAPVCEPTYASAPAPVVSAPPPQPVYVPQVAPPQPNVYPVGKSKVHGVKNIDDSTATAKRKIQETATDELGGRIDVVCSTGTFSYIVNTELYCETEKDGITCFAFRQSS
ncbi:ground-like domain protein [Necator americanus]|uniref:Ground-like domain protein n=1 Tax=Necator americanus TaxID=51031 RepID=W2TSN8_NECAM|nr:ground-like domain protein [Necator americanus]ETN85105.1 ground-like domain protein [Necator americanus]